jgi:hypothetical protein
MVGQLYPIFPPVRGGGTKGQMAVSYFDKAGFGTGLMAYGVM